jgi:hypothetical protein
MAGAKNSDGETPTGDGVFRNKAYQAMRANPAPLPFFQEAHDRAFEPGMGEVVETFACVGEPS